MLWEPLKKRLEQILNTGVRLDSIKTAAWNPEASSIEMDGRVHFYLEQEANEVKTLSVEPILTASERQLLELMISAFRERGATDSQAATDGSPSKKMAALRAWVCKQLENGGDDVELPDSFSSIGSLYAMRVPILLYGEKSAGGSTDDLRKLLDTFFDEEILLVPLLDKEWLILAPEAVISDSHAGEGKDEESVEEALESIGRGLHEMLVEEWTGECHLATDYPIIPAKEVVSTVARLREMVRLGRQYRMGSYIHLSWQLHLEQLLDLLPEAEKKSFAENILKRMDYAMDSETLQTLEQFFALDCNVSETAKKLYIHRNTLLYRLDKFKQETGLDVRTFSHAVLVKIALVLYKVTKRK